MAESVVTFLLKKLASLAEEELKLLGGVEGGIVFIRDELQSIKAFLRVADSLEDSDPEIQAWVKQVRDVAYETDDVLDEFMLHLARHHRRGFWGSLSKIYHWKKSLKVRHQIASQIRDIKTRVIDIAQRRERYNYKFSFSSSSALVPNINTWYDRRGDALLLEEADLVGIDEPKQQFINWLLDPDNSQLKVISVVGMGGSGKTTLVKKVYDDKQVKSHFQSHAWVTVSQSFKIEELLRDLIQQLFSEVRRPHPQSLETMDSNKLKVVLKEFLQASSRYVLVLDDVWSINAWHAIKIALPNRNCGSHVLLTTRIGDVASTSCVEHHGHIYEMKALSAEESWTLFCRKTFYVKDCLCPPYLRKLSESILRRCEGLPLAIVSIAGVLASKDQSKADEWESVNRSLGNEVQGSEHFQSMRKILLLSYNDLPYYLKSCFLYLSGFPEDHLIEWTSTIQLWIAEGFVEEKQGKTLEEVAESYLYDLLKRSLIQIAQKRVDGRVRSFHLHDLLREIIVSKARDQTFLTITGDENLSWPERVRRLSIHNNLQTIQQGKCVSQLRSLFMFGVVDPLTESSIPLLFNGDLRLLKVLHLRKTSLDVFPHQVVKKLFHLKYLSLRGTKVKVLPKSIGMLRNLETLDLKYTSVRKLPAEILLLQQLRNLFVYHYQIGLRYVPFPGIQGLEAPSKIGDLQSLQKLCFIEANHVTIVKEIGRLTQLRRLGIVKLRREDGLALCSSLEKLTNLRSFDVTSIEEDEILDLQSLSPSPQFLQRLYLRGRLEKLPHWITSLHSLVSLVLRGNKLRDADSLQSLQDLPNLVELELEEAYEGEGLCVKAGGFQSLKFLEIVKLKGLRWVKVEEGAITRLEKLIIMNCELMEELPAGVEHLSNLKLLQLDDMSDTLISKLNRDLQDGDYCKIAHISKVFIGHSRDGRWKGNFL